MAHLVLDNFVNPPSHRRGMPIHSAFVPPRPYRLSGCSHLACRRGMQNQSLGGFFSSLVDFVKTTNSAPLKAVGALVTGGPSAALAQTKADVKQGAYEVAGVASVAAPIASLFGPIGGIVAVGLKAIKTVVDNDKAQAAYDYGVKQQIAKALGDNVSNPQNLMDAYKAIAGAVPGRFIGLDVMEKVLNTAFTLGAIPPGQIDAKGNRKLWTSMEQDFIRSSGGKCYTNKYACCDGLATLASAHPNASAEDIVNAYMQCNTIHAADLGAGTLERQIFIDAADAALAKANPNAAFTYGIDLSAVPAMQAPSTSNVPAASPQVTAPIGPMTTVPVSVQPVLKINAPDISQAPAVANQTQDALLAMQTDMLKLRAQLDTAQKQNDAQTAQQSIAQIKQLQDMQAQTAQMYAQAVQASQPTSQFDPSQVAALVASQLSQSGISPTGAVASGISVGSGQTILGMPRNVALIGGAALVLGGVWFLARRSAKSR